MTIPTLIANYKERVLITKIKKTYSEFTNSIQLYTAKNGCSNILCLFDVSKSSIEVLEELMTVFNNSKFCNDKKGTCADYNIKSNKPFYIKDGVYAPTDGIAGYKILLKNGSSIHIRMSTTCIHPKTCTDSKGNTYDCQSDYCGYVYLDVNGVNEPNQFCVDVFRFIVKSNGTLSTECATHLDNIIRNNELDYVPYNFGDSAE